MRTLSLSFATLGLLLLSLTGCAKDGLTEQQVQQLLDEVTLATQQKNIEGIVSHLSANAKIEVIVDMGAGPQSMVFDRQEYKNMLREGWAQVSEHTYASKNIDISLSGDGSSAFVRSDTIETMKISGQRMEVKAKETLTIEMVEGAPKIVKIVSQPV